MGDTLPTNTFIGISLPDSVASFLQDQLRRYQPHIARKIPVERLHLTLAFLGDIPISEELVSTFASPMHVPFLPTVSISHIGPAPHKSQLWAYAQATPVLVSLHDTVHTQLRKSGLVIQKSQQEFVPHVTLATVSKDLPSFGLSDSAASATFAIQSITLWQSHANGEERQYTPLAEASIAS